MEKNNLLHKKEGTDEHEDEEQRRLFSQDGSSFEGGRDSSPDAPGDESDGGHASFFAPPLNSQKQSLVPILTWNSLPTSSTSTPAYVTVNCGGEEESGNESSTSTHSQISMVSVSGGSATETEYVATPRQWFPIHTTLPPEIRPQPRANTHGATIAQIPTPVAFSELPRITKIKYVLAISFLVACFFATNMGLNLLNKYVFSTTGFKFPLFLTMCHALEGTCLGLLVTFIFKSNERLRFKRIDIVENSKSLMLLGLMTSLNVGLNNMSLLFITVTFNQIVRALLPISTAVISFFVEGRRYRSLYLIGISFVSLGVVGSVLKNPQWDLTGFLLVACSTISASVNVVMSASLMAGPNKLGPVNLIIYIGPFIALCCLPFVVWLEGTGLFHYSKDNGVAVLAIVLITGMLAFVYNVIHWILVDIVGSVLSTCVGNAKTVVLIIVSETVMNRLTHDADMAWYNWIGVAVTLVAFFFVSLLQARKQDRFYTQEDENKGGGH